MLIYSMQKEILERLQNCRTYEKISLKKRGNQNLRNKRCCIKDYFLNIYKVLWRWPT